MLPEVRSERELQCERIFSLKIKKNTKVSFISTLNIICVSFACKSDQTLLMCIEEEKN